MTEKEKYAALCAQEPSICVYDQPWWLDAVCGEDHWDVLLYEKGGEIVGAMPYYLKTRYGLRYITQPVETQHNGIWIRYPEKQKYEKRLMYEKEIITRFLKQLETQPVVFFRQALHPRQTNWLPYYWMGYHQTTHYTYVIPSKSKPLRQIEQGYATAIRYDAKKAAETIKIEDSVDLDTFYDLHCKTFQRQGQTAPISREFFYRFDAACSLHQARKLFLARGEDGTAYCAIYLVYDQNCMYYLMSGTDAQYRKFNALSLLLTHAIAFASQAGLDFDFEGSMVEKIEDYFRKFGGEQVPYFCVKKVYTKLPVLRSYLNHKMLL